MRLINSESLTLEEFIGGGYNTPKYAILSHTWEDGEVTFQDFAYLNRDERAQKKGFRKIQKTCDLAKKAGLKYAWVDTCCIIQSHHR
jgi:Heterokaryon incompatibility protein (HET)